MNKPVSFSGNKALHGMSLVELMIAMVLGLALVAGAMKIFIANTQAFRLQDNVSDMQGSSRLAMEIFLADLRRAGLDKPDANDSFAGANGSATKSTIAGLLTDSDEVTISYGAPEAMTDCEGHAANPGQVIYNRYFIAVDANPAVPALFCAGGVGAPPLAINPGVALLRGVESFQLLFGLTQGNGTLIKNGNGYASPVRYVAAGDVGADVLVAAVQVALLVRTEAGIQGVTAPAANIAVLDTSASVADLSAVKVDGRYPIHRLFVGTAAIRNRAVGRL